MGFKRSLRKFFQRLKTRKNSTVDKERSRDLPDMSRSWSPVSFYDEKSSELPRFLYRRLHQGLMAATHPSERSALLKSFLEQVEQQGAKGDFQKFKWVLPTFLKENMTPEEATTVESVFSARRQRRNHRLIEVYPHCADEFTLEPSFLDAVLNVKGSPWIGADTRVFTIGSCFARNIAVFLSSQGYNAHSFPLAEDLNSPLSNAKMLSVAIEDEDVQSDYFSYWLSRLQPQASSTDIRKQAFKERERLQDLIVSLKAAQVIVVTVGNIFDFFLADTENDIAPDVPVAPKFFRIWQSEDVGTRGTVSKNLKSAGAVFRMATYSETIIALERLRGAILAINPDAFCIFTLSPVPFDSAVGLEHTLTCGSMELDCISKSTLRAAMHEFFGSRKETDPNLLYFPSFEIVRWIGAMSPGPTFGSEDAASRNVSAHILNAVYHYFLLKFGVVTPKNAVETYMSDYLS